MQKKFTFPDVMRTKSFWMAVIIGAWHVAAKKLGMTEGIDDTVTTLLSIGLMAFIRQAIGNSGPVLVDNGK